MRQNTNDSRFPGRAETIASDAFWRLEMDILSRRRFEGQITRQRAKP